MRPDARRPLPPHYKYSHSKWTNISSLPWRRDWLIFAYFQCDKNVPVRMCRIENIFRNMAEGKRTRVRTLMQNWLASAHQSIGFQMETKVLVGCNNNRGKVWITLAAFNFERKLKIESNLISKIFVQVKTLPSYVWLLDWMHAMRQCEGRGAYYSLTWTGSSHRLHSPRKCCCLCTPL